MKTYIPPSFQALLLIGFTHATCHRLCHRQKKPPVAQKLAVNQQLDACATGATGKRHYYMRARSHARAKNQNTPVAAQYSQLACGTCGIKNKILKEKLKKCHRHLNLPVASPVAPVALVSVQHLPPAHVVVAIDE